MKILSLLSVAAGTLVPLCFATAQSAQGVPTVVEEFYPNTMNAKPFIPADLNALSLECGTLRRGNEEYLSANQVNYAKPDWESRVNHRTDYLQAAANDGRITIIDFATLPDDLLGYKYISNANTHNQLYEPWSSSKIFAYTGAVATVRRLSEANGVSIGSKSTVGDVSIGDLITSINSYESTNSAPDDSNAIATYFANIASRDYLTALFHDEWLQIENKDVRFRGAYGPKAYKPSDTRWQSGTLDLDVHAFENASDDPGYQGYRCEGCELTGNKPMTTLAQAEWLKRLASHTREKTTRHPYLLSEDIHTLFYGDTGTGGMMAGISRMLPNALARVIAPGSKESPKQILDQITQGQWRIFQKIGWGPSETRTTGENVVLAHVCLPHFQGGREFTIAAQASQAGYGDEFVNYAGMKMQDLLYRSVVELLYPIE